MRYLGGPLADLGQNNRFSKLCVTIKGLSELQLLTRDWTAPADGWRGPLQISQLNLFCRHVVPLLRKNLLNLNLKKKKKGCMGGARL